MLNFLFALLIAPILLFQQPNFRIERDIIKKATNDSLVVDAYLKIIKSFNPNQTDSIANYFNKALTYTKQNNYNQGETLVNFNAGKYSVNHGELSKAETYLLAALKTVDQKKNKSLKANILNNLGVVYGKRGDYELAMKNVLMSLKIFEDLKDNDGQTSSYIKLGVISRLNGDLKLAFSHNDKAEQINKKLKDKAYQIDILNNKAILYAMQGDFDNALKMFQAGYDIAEKGGLSFISSKVNCLMNIGLVYKEKGQYEKALEYLQKSAEEAEKGNLPNERIRNQLNIALLYTDQNKFEASNDIALKTLVSAKKASFQDLVTETLDLITHNYKSLNDYKNALKYNEEFFAEENKLKNAQRDKEIADLQSTYDLKKAQEQVKLLDQLNQEAIDQRELMILLTVLGFLSMSVFAFYYFRIKKLHHEISLQRTLLIDSNEIKNKLFSIIGHDLRSAYNSTLGFLNLLKDGDLNKEEEELFIGKVITQSQSALETLDNLLMWGHSQIKGTKITTAVFEAGVEVQKNIAFLKDQFLAKQISIEISDQCNVPIKADVNHFDFVIRNLLSNAIKFTPENGSIKISCSDYGQNQQKFCVADTGIGMTKEQINQIFNTDSKSTLGTSKEKGTGLGLMLSKEFIELNGGKIWTESELGKGSKFCFVLDKG
ncbi:tetratricopeptide repeat-containing sensor histidine kinase [Pedobacter cryophilus]|uniref:histidine kinase n=1 Tax=Pedobacter cryophilus TaxID=2571271 RepID=A0A4U1BUJ2_9SPHI|nr:tetratricopeptide repeat-containing sensor histidine kinase [Pedobacter cryophilus]TKB96352.1 sensor histidine kinase [Pedobacter cryophilus]